MRPEPYGSGLFYIKKARAANAARAALFDQARGCAFL